MLTLRRDLNKKTEYDESVDSRNYSNKTCENNNRNYVKEYDYSRNFRNNQRDYCNQDNCRMDSEFDNRDYAIVNNASDEYRNYLWNELTREVPRKIYSEEEYNKYLGGRYNYNQNYTDEFRAEEPENKEMANYELASENKKKHRRVLNRSGKIAICAYFLFVSIIVLLIALSSNINNNVMASNDSPVQNNASIDESKQIINNDEFYSSKTKINYDNVSEEKLLPVIAASSKEKSNNWFDSVCDFIENLVGG